MFKSAALKVLSKTPASLAPIMATSGVVLLSAAYLYSPAPPPDLRVFETGVEIKINRTSPAFAALEDIHETFEKTQQDSVSPYIPISSLTAGTSSVEDEAMQIVTENQALLRAQEIAQLIAKRVEQEKAERLQAFLQSVFAKKEVAHVAQAPTTNSYSNAVSQTQTPAKKSAGFSAPEPGTLIVSNGQIIPFEEKSDAPATETKTVSLAELKISKEELLNGLILPLMAAQAKEQKPNPSRTATRVAGLSRPTPARQNPTAVAPKPEMMGEPAARFSTNDSAPGLVANEVATAASAGPRTIAGTIEMLGGLALTSGKDEIVVYREVDGERAEWGNVWLREGRYEIYVEDTEGELIAELQNRGAVLGRGEFRLSDLGKGDVALKLRPVRRGLIGATRSIYSTASKVEPVADVEIKAKGLDLSAESKENGKFQNEDLAPGSVVVTQTRRAGFWGTLGYAQAGNAKSLTLFPNRMMEAFVSVMGSKSQFTSDRPPVIWGRVVNGSQPVSGAKVELLTGEQEIKAVYFNALMIPDPTLTATSANGMYAFFPVEPGVQVVQVVVGPEALEPVVLPAESGYVSAIDLEARRGFQVGVKVFDAFRTQLPLSAELQALGSERWNKVNATGQAKLKLAKANGFMIMDAHADEKYGVTRLTIHGEPKSMLVPMVDKAWLAKIEAQAGVNRNRESGIIVGFNRSGNRFQVFPSSESDTSNMRVAYFDAKGQLLNSNNGSANGGYVIFNVPEGFATVSLVAEAMAGVQAVTTLTEGSVVNVLHHTIK